jgi:hypothetical protein
MFVDSYSADGNDDFLSASGKTRKEKRAEKKAAKEEKLRLRKGAEIDAAAKDLAGDLLGIPNMPMPPEKKKKGLKGLVSNIKDKRQDRQADKLYKKDYAKAKKSGTLSTADGPLKSSNPTPNERNIGSVMDTIKKGVGAVKGLIPGQEDDEPVVPAKKTAKSADVAKWVILGLGAAALVAILFSKGLPAKKTVTA